MINPFMFKDNLILHLHNPTMKMDTKVWATGEQDKFKVCRGMEQTNRHYTTEFLNMYELENMSIDHLVMGYEARINFVFPDGLDGVVKRRVHSLDLLRDKPITTEIDVGADVGIQGGCAPISCGIEIEKNPAYKSSNGF
jgi:hypothetical protein